jgi:hypothetical protein
MNFEPGDYKNPALIKNVIILSTITLIVGILLFSTWWFARALFAYNIESFFAIALGWSFFSIGCSLFMVALTIIYIARNRKLKLSNAWSALILILVNYIAFYLITELYATIEQRAYFKIINGSGLDITSIKVKTSTFEKQIENLNQNQSTVVSFQPCYIVHPNDDSVDIVDSVFVHITTVETTRMAILPEMMKGDCESFEISPEFEILH